MSCHVYVFPARGPCRTAPAAPTIKHPNMQFFDYLNIEQAERHSLGSKSGSWKHGGGGSSDDECDGEEEDGVEDGREGGARPRANGSQARRRRQVCYVCTRLVFCCCHFILRQLMN